MEYEKYIHTFICVTPLIWGIYEFRKFRQQIEGIKTKADEINKKIDDISNNNLESYPFFKDLKDLVDKINVVFKPNMNVAKNTKN
tara:strand:- start:465 stop:719 length:255 start_codon:yes stop_codon:yes gene_type:complete